MSSSVILCSGGFDSVVLAHHVRKMLGEEEDIHILFFDYGQKSVEQERSCSKKVSAEIKAYWKEIKLPKMTWSKGMFYSKKYHGEDMHYLEWRNLIFLAYAFSYAQSIQAIEIYAAFFRVLNPDDYFKDACPQFVDVMNMLDPNIEVEVPFMGMTKESLVPLARYYNISREDFFSCDYPKEDGSPCGECADCKVVDGLLAEI